MFKRHWRRWLIGAVVGVIVLAVGGPYVFIHFIEGSPKPKLALPASSSSASTAPWSTASSSTAPSSAASGTQVATSPSISGNWQVSSGSVAGYRVQEVLLGQSTTAVGRTSKVSGQFHLAGETVQTASFTVQMASVVSNQSQRNAQFDGRIMDVAAYPTSTFVLTKPIRIGTIPPVGTTVKELATGKLTLHGVTKAITIDLSAERVSTGIDVLGDGNIVFSTFNISNPSVAGFVTTANHGTLEVLLHLTRS